MKKVLAVIIIAILIIVSVLFALGRVQLYTYIFVILLGFLYVKLVQPKL